MKEKNVQVYWRDRTHARPDMRLLSKIAEEALKQSKLIVPPHTFLQISFIGSAQMTQLNAEVLGHIGDTDVITLDYRWDKQSDGADLLSLPMFDNEPFGELFICPAVAERQLMNYKNRNYPRELITYIVHGILHLCGEDDLQPQARKKMKRKERAQVIKLTRYFDFDALFF